MKKRTSSMSRRIVSLLMSMVLTLTLVTPAAFATEVVGGSGTAIIEGNANPADANPNEDTEGKNDVDKNTENGAVEQPTDSDDEDKNPGEGEGDANKPAEDNKGEENPAEDKKDEDNKDEQPTEDENNGDDEIALLNAENAADVWAGADAEGGIDTSWYNDNDKDFKISTAAQFAGLAQLVNEGNNFSKKTIQLTKDIRLNEQDVPTGGHEWTPIGKNPKRFEGTFDGNGHTVSGLYINDTTVIKGLFGRVNNATIKNLIVTGSVTVPKKANIGGIVGYASNSTIQNCGFYGTVTAGPSNTGGVIGGGKTVLNCWYYHAVSTATTLGVFGANNAGSYCYQNVSENNSKGIYAANFNSEEVVKELNKGDNVAAGKIWALDEAEGAVYPKLIDPPKTITLKPIFPDCAATVSVNDTELNVNNDYTYEVTGDVTITASIEGICYGKEGATGSDLTPITSSGVSYTGPFPATLFYGTEDDFDALAAWNSALDRSGKTATIKDAVTLKALARMVNSGKDEMTGKTITLDANIDLNNEPWTPIGTADHPFKGTFNGNKNTTYYAISNLNGDLFGVVDDGLIQYVTIDGGKGRLVGELKSGTVQYCMSTAEVTGAGGGLVGTSTGTVQNSGKVNSCYYYNAKSKNTPAVAGSGTVTNCFYLAETSTFDKKGTADDIGARTAEEFAAGRVTWELNGGKGSLKKNVTWGMQGNMPFPVGGITNNKVDGRVYELTLTKAYAPGNTDIQLKGGDGVTVFHNGDTWYAYCIGSSGPAPEVTVDASGIGEDNVVTYGANGEPKEFAYIVNSNGVTDTTKNTYYYTISKEAKADTSWYDESKEKFTLSNTAELFGFAKLVNEGKNFEKKTVELAADVDLTGYVWTPIGLKNSFAGTFDGGSHKVTGMSVQAKEIQRAGLFGEVSGTVQNVQVEGTVNVTDAAMIYAGGIAGYVQTNGTVQNCLSMVNVCVKLSGNNNSTYVGGVVGYNTSTVNLCWNKGNVQGTGGTTFYTRVGGVVGVGTVANCANFGEVTGNGSTGGIAGDGTVSNSYNLGAVSGRGAAGITGKGTVTNSYYLCKLNGAEAAKYVNSNDEQDITTAEKDGKTVYKVSDDVLVDVLNKDENRGTYIEWINKQDAPYNPVHIKRWDGSFEPGVEGVATLVYDPNGGDGQQQNDMKMVVGNGSADFTVKSADEVGFRHENGTFLGWSTDPRAKTADNRYAAGKTVSVEKDKTVTLYAVWENIWTGSGTEADAYQISNAADLTALQTQVNEKGFSYTGKWFRLTNNIDLNNELWTPIGVDALHSFGGSLDGGGKTISGLKVETNGAWAGLFGSVRGTYGVPMTMRDLTLKDGSVTTTFTGTSFCGGLVAIVEGETALELRNVVAENLTVSGGISGSGGLLGRGRVAMTNCHNRGGSVTGEYAGGLAGKGYSTLQDHVLAGCTNSAKVVGERTAGGMTGNETDNDGSYTDCTNSGSISATQGYASGIAAGGSYERCSNSGAVTGKQAAGITSNGYKATFCSNTGAIKGTDYAAGILTNGGYGGTVEFCWNTGKVEASTPVKAFGILYGWGAYNRVRNSFSYVPGANIGLAPTELKEENVSDSYYLADKKDSVSSAGEWASADDFASGKVAWGVDGGVNAHKNYWTQGANNYPVPIGEGTSTSYYRAKAECGTGGAVSIKSSRNFTGDADNAVYGPKGMSVTVTATPKDDTFGLKSLTLDLMSTGTTADLANPGSFALGAANAKVVATFASTGNGGSGGGTGGNGGDGDGTGTDTGDGAGDENDEGLQDGLNMDVEYNIKGLVLAAYAEWGANGGGKTFAQWLKDSPSVLRAFITNSLDNMAAAAKSKDTDEAKGLAALLLASLNEHSGLNSKNGDIIGKALQRYMDTGSEATFSTWLTTGSGMASGTVEEILAQYTDSLLNLTERLYTNWESSGTSLTFPVWLDAQQVTMESLSENAEEPDTDTDDTQTSEAPEDVPDGQEAEGGASGGGNSVWEVIGTVVRENPIIVWSIVAVIAALVIVGAVRRYHKVKRDERDDAASKK